MIPRPIYWREGPHKIQTIIVIMESIYFTLNQGGGYRIDGLHENDGYPSFSCNFRLQLQFTQSSSAQIQIFDSNNCSRRSYLEFKKKNNPLRAI